MNSGLGERIYDFYCSRYTENYSNSSPKFDSQTNSQKPKVFHYMKIRKLGKLNILSLNEPIKVSLWIKRTRYTLYQKVL